MSADELTARLQAMREIYTMGGLSEDELQPTWLQQFRVWLADAEAAKIREPNAMVLATASPDGVPSARTVLLKGVDERGFVFFTNRLSRKGREAAANPRASLVFPWIELQRQVVVCGSVELVDDATSDAYFAERPRSAQLGAIASPQSEIVSGRAELEEQMAAAEAAHPEGVTPVRPAHWGGLRVVPETVEFWHGRRGRLHDRLRFQRSQPDWSVVRVAP